MVNNTKYIGNAPIVGSKKTLAFYAFCDKTGKEEAYYWENPLGDTVKSVLFRKLFFFHSSPLITTILYSFRTFLLFLGKKNAVEVGCCEKCGNRKIRCRHVYIPENRAAN